MTQFEQDKNILIEMKKISIVLVIILSLLSCINSKARHKEKFLKHIHNNTPDPYKECMVYYIDKHWDEVWEIYETEKPREPRGETDIVNFMIMKFLSECKKQ